jgi:hypothetical protein
MTVGTRWRAIPRWGRVAVVVVALVVAVNAGLLLVDSATRGRDESGARSSSFSTGEDGTAGFAELLRRYGHDVTRARGTVRFDSLDPAGVAIVLDARPEPREARAVAQFVRAGGRLVAGGPDAEAWVEALPIEHPSWVPGGARDGTATVDGTRYRIRTDGGGRWDDARGPLVVEPHAPGGSTLLLADASPLSNALLDRADNAALGLALAGSDARVTFVEGPHGYGGASGLAAIPGRWKVALVLGTVAALLALIAGARRIGPAEETTRRLPPPRRAYVDALGVALARSRRPADAIAPLQLAARKLLAARAGLAPDAGDEEIRAAAARAGWTTSEIDALFAPASSEDAVVRAGRALARAEREHR